MKISYASDACKKQNNDVCFVTEHKLEGQNKINSAVIQIKGRYPTQGRCINQQCNELAYLSAGSGKVVIEGKEIWLNTGDTVIIEKGEKYFWDGNMDLFVACTPAWYAEQHVYIEAENNVIA